MPDIPTLKQQLRVSLSATRKSLSDSQRQSYSSTITKHLLNVIQTYQGEKQTMQLLVYKALPFEVDTDILFSVSGLECFVPRMLPDAEMEWVLVNQHTTWKTMRFGVMEPEQGKLWQASEKIRTLLVCPLLGFDRQGNRLGMGKGYFDRWLEKHRQTVDTQLGLAFSCQELPKVPTEQHDARLSIIITERGVITCPAT